MTVEQSPLPLNRAGQRTRNENLTYAKVREVTGAPDDVIEEAIRACSHTDGTYKVEDVVTTIIADDSVLTANKAKQNKSHSASTKPLDHVDALPGGLGTTVPNNGAKSLSTVASSSSPSSSSSSKVTQPNSDEYIDLTRDSQGILGGQVSKEEQDISRILEASLAESKGISKRKRGELWFIDPLNPHERKRQEGWPVGLKNVGNTCWFSAVIQSLFHIHKFREIVLNYKERIHALNEPQVTPNLRFVSELRKLFALLLLTNRKYVDPSKAVDILKQASSSTALDGQQQDVSEFQHKLLDWLEDAFRSPKESSCGQPQTGENPVNQLFQGKYKAEGVHEGTTFSQEVTFGQYPLNVVGFRDIHESLEATTAQGEIETVSGDANQTSKQEIWFTHLPMVLTFELSRFGFNQQLNRAEKIHQQLSFPPVIYVDRYLECNKSVTRQKREEARKLKEELRSLQTRLDKFMNYGSSNKRYPLPDVLQYALEFAQSSPPQGPTNLPSTPQHSSDIEMESPVPFSRAENTPTHISAVALDVSMSSNSDNATETPAEKFTAPQRMGSLSQAATMTPMGFGGYTCRASSSSPTAACATISDKQDGKTLTPTSPALSTAAPEAKKFKDSSVQADYNNVTLLPSSTASSSSSSSSSQPLTPSQSRSRSVPKLVSPMSSSPSVAPPVSVLASVDPHPKAVSEGELRVLQDCLQRWRHEVETDVRELQRNISLLEGKLDRMYSDDYMKKYPYHLHAVLVHEGQAVSGHYWSFIYDDHRLKWLKFNDITVSESSLEEMHKESVGGFLNASAYCLMYVDKSRLELGHGDASSSVPSTIKSPASLPSDLLRVVNEDNAVFSQEIISWDEEQKRKSVVAATTSPSLPSTSSQPSMPATTTTASTMTSPPSSLMSPQGKSASELWSGEQGQAMPRSRSHSDEQEVVVTGEQRPGEATIIQPMNSNLSHLAKQHAQLSMQATLRAVTEITGSNIAISNPQEVMIKALEREHRRLEGLSRIQHTRLPAEDLRLGHIVLYLLSSGADHNTVRVILSEQFSFCVLLDTPSRVKGVRQKAQEMYAHLYRLSNPDSIKFYEFWHKRYNHYREAIYMFAVAVEAYCSDRFQEAMPYFNQAWLHNCEPSLPKSSKAPSGINPQMLAYFRRSCLKKLNTATLKMFECDTDMTDALTVMVNLILPSLAHLANSEYQADTAMVEEVRETWCQFLEKDLSDQKIERLQDFLSKMFENGSAVLEGPRGVRPNDLVGTLEARYIQAMRKLKERGELLVWMEDS